MIPTNEVQKKKTQTYVRLISVFAATSVIAVLAGCTSAPAGSLTPAAQQSAAAGSSASQSGATGEDLVIPISGVSETATFYPVKVDGTKMEVLAVQAPDGSVRTAFNTCQVCYDSGRGYYKQQGTALVCQNCGNHFTMDQVEVVSGGCNPVPILPANKTVTNDSITISNSFLKEAKVIFENWKTAN